ncbi:hypothetical protein F4810DRAFT_707635 [Camillea tinctor]|nr:hypothetical protein F4810DRAFT_707635 [Camillea tinctor]
MTDNIAADLGPLLSPQASIVLPGDATFSNLVSRWREYEASTISAVVQVSTEADVQQTVRYSLEHDIPFMARAGGHGATETLATAKNPIQIDFRSLNQVKLSKDGTAATIGGGATVKQVVSTLEDRGKRPGKKILRILHETYGLMADQVVSARLVLPNSELVTVSEKSNPDLFWAIRGAGHNFGLVTEWEFRVYDIKNPKWSYEIFIYSGDKLEALYNLANTMLKDQPPEPILWFAIIYDGPTETARKYAKPLHGIGPIMVQSGEATMHELDTS